MELYSMERLSKMSEEEKEAVAQAAEQDFDNGIREPALTTLKALSDMGNSYSTVALLDYLTGGYNNLIGTPDLSAAKALLNGAGQRLDPGDQAYFAAIISLREFNDIASQRNRLTGTDLYTEPALAPIHDAFVQAVLGLHEARDARSLSYILNCGNALFLFTCGGYDLHWGELAQICCWLMENPPEEPQADPRQILTNSLKSVAQNVCLHIYVTDGEAVLLNMIHSYWHIAFEDFQIQPYIFMNKNLRGHFFEQYRVAAPLPLYGIHAELLQEIRRHLSYFSDFEGYDPNVFPKKKLFGNPAPNSQLATYNRECEKYK